MIVNVYGGLPGGGRPSISLFLLVLFCILIGIERCQGMGNSVHTVFPTECGAYFAWQTLGMVYSHRKAGQPGPLTRIVSCTEEQWQQMSDAEKKLVRTHRAPSYTVHPRTKDVYAAYNKPVAVIDWIARTDIKEDYILIIDADMIMRKAIIPDEVGASPGWAVAAFFGYMKGVNNELAMKHVPDVKPRTDTLAGPKGRRGDQAGGFTLMHIDDLRKVAPRWLKFTEDVRFDPDAWKLTGDAYSKNPGDKPWISEMYGYSFACSKSDVWHHTPQGMMLYPGYPTTEPPFVLHYGLLWEVPNTGYKFDKHWHYGFDPFKCTPWNLDSSDSRNIKGGLFPHPPRPSLYKKAGAENLVILLAMEPIITLNAAMCEHHRTHCIPTDELKKECSIVDEYEHELAEALDIAVGGIKDTCVDLNSRCKEWKDAGECEKNVGYMRLTCKKSCGVCGDSVGNAVKPKKDVTTRQQQTDGEATIQKQKDYDQEITSDYEQTEDYDGEINASENDYENVNRVEIDSDAKENNDVLDTATALKTQNNLFTNEQFAHQKPLVNVVQGQILADFEQQRKRFEEEQLKQQQEELRRQKQKEEEELRRQKQKEEEERERRIQLENQKQEDEQNAMQQKLEAKEEDMAMYTVADLKLRCTKFPKWTKEQIRSCLNFADDGIEYDPEIFDPLDRRGLGLYSYGFHDMFVDDIYGQRKPNYGFWIILSAFVGLGVHKLRKNPRLVQRLLARLQLAVQSKSSERKN